MHPFRPGAKQTLRQYYEVPVDILEDPQELAAWARYAALPPSAQLVLPFAWPSKDTFSCGDLSVIAGAEA